MALISICGLQNDGKTALMTYFLFIEFCRGRTIVSNYHLEFPHILINKDKLIDMATKQESIRNACFGFDELWIWLDCRKAIENTVATYFFNQSSKEGNDIYATAQFNTQNDKRFRDNLHRVIQTRRVVHKDNKFYEVVNDNRFLSDEMNKNLYIRFIEFRKTNMGLMTELKHHKTGYIKVKPLFSLYDTRERIKNE